MAYPTKYARQYDFQSYQNANPTRPLPGDKVNVDFNFVVTSIGQVIEFQKLVQRSDGALTNGIVTVDSLSDAVKMLIADADVIDDLTADFAAVEANKTAAAASAASASSSKTAAATSATNAATSETNAAASETAAAASETAAAASETAAATSETNAAASETAALAAQTAAEAAQAAAEVAADNFDDVYLGSKASDPTVDNDGNALFEGQLYWSTSSNALKIYDGSAWQSYNPLAGIAAVVDDTTPQLGGDLDLNGHDITGMVIGTDISAVKRSINAQTGTTYTFVIGDAGKICTFSNASAVTVTVPPNSSVAFPVGTQIDVTQKGAGKVTLAQGSGVTINSLSSNKSLAGQYAGATLLKTATDTWTLVGALIP